jgi:hypothetical protein
MEVKCWHDLLALYGLNSPTYFMHSFFHERLSISSSRLIKQLPRFCCTTFSSRSFTTTARLIEWQKHPSKTRKRKRRKVKHKNRRSSYRPRISCSASRWRHRLGAFSLQPAGPKDDKVSPTSRGYDVRTTYWQITTFSLSPCPTPSTSSPSCAPLSCPPKLSCPSLSRRKKKYGQILARRKRFQCTGNCMRHLYRMRNRY